MLLLVFFSWMVRTETPVTSEPVPQVVGTAATGYQSASGSFAKRISAPFDGFFAIREMAFAASMGDPPPMPMKKSAPSRTATSRAFMTVSMDGFSSISLKMQ